MSDTLWIRLARGVESGAAVAWARLDDTGRVLEHGLDTPDRFPADLPCKAVVAAADVLWLRQAMPGGRALRGAALAFALEDRLVDEPEAVHAVAGRVAADGTAMVAVVARDWLDAALAACGPRRPEYLLPEPMLLGATAEVWRLAWTARPCLATGQGAVELDTEANAARQTIELALAQAQPRPARLDVLGDATRPRPDLEEWTHMLGLPVVAGPDYDWASAAWQVSESAQRAELDLLPNGLRSGTRPRLHWPGWRPALRLAIVLVAVNGLSYLGLQGGLVWQVEQARQANRGLFLSAFPDSKVVVDPQLQMRRKVDELRRHAGESSMSDFLPLLDRAGQVLPAPLQEQVREIRYEGARLILQLPSAGLDALDWAGHGLRVERRAAAIPGTVDLILERLP